MADDDRRSDDRAPDGGDDPFAIEDPEGGDPRGGDPLASIGAAPRGREGFASIGGLDPLASIGGLDPLASIGGPPAGGDGFASIGAPSRDSLASMGAAGARPGVAALNLSDGDDADASNVTGEHLGRYAHIRELGRGGIGRVTLVHDTHLGRDLAVKELLPEHVDATVTADSARTTAFRNRFLREARVTGQLEHPSVIPVYELGRRRDGTLYYTMKLVRGRTLADALAECDDIDERLALLPHFHNLCLAIAYAHSRGVIHRDIKPDNVMVGEFGETVVLDWGLAKVAGRRDIRGGKLERQIELLMRDQAGGSTDATLDGHALGTPAYMSPEQAAGEVEEMDARSDVWGLGAVLYEILTGEPPFHGGSAYEIVGRVMREAVVPPRERNPHAPPALAAVAQKALQRDRDDRYLSAAELADELESYRSGRRVEAYEYSTVELLERIVRNHKPALAVAVTALAVLLVIAAGAFRGISFERDNALDAYRQGQRYLGEALAEKAFTFHRDGDWAGADFYAAEALARRDAPAVRGLVMELDLAWRPALVWENRPGTRCADIALSPDGQLVACATHMGIPLWGQDGGREVLRLTNAGGWLSDVAFSPGGDEIAAASAGEVVRVWSLGGEILREHKGHEREIRAIAYAPGGAWIASASEDGDVRLWPRDAGGEARVFEHGAPVTDVAFAPNGKLVASAGDDGKVHLWPLGPKDNPPRILFVRREKLRAIAFSPGGGVLAVAGADRAIRLWNVASGEVEAVLAGHEDEISALAFSDDGAWVISGSADGAVRLWSASTGELLGQLTAHDGRVDGVALRRADGVMLTAASDRRVRSWRFDPSPPPRELAAAAGELAAVAVSDDGLLVAAGGDDHTVQIWERASGRHLTTLRGHSEPIAALDFHPSGRVLASASHDRSVRLWDLENDAERIRLEPHRQKVRALAFSPDGRYLATAGDDRTVQVTDLEKEGEAFRLEGHEALVTCLGFDPAGQRLVSGGWDRVARVWDLESGEVLARLEGHTGNVNAVAFAKDRVVTASSDGHLKLWELGESRPVIDLAVSEAPLRAVVVAGGGSLVAIAGDAKPVELWSLTDRRALARFGGPRERARALALHGDTESDGTGAVLLAAGDDQRVHQWRLDRLHTGVDELTRSARARYGLDLDGTRAVPRSADDPPPRRQ